MSPTAYASQLPRLSKYDPGAFGEGSLDPMGVAAVADRIAELLAPGLRARMSHPRFVTLSAIGAYAGMPHHGVVASDRMSTPDLAFEWMAVEALVRYRSKELDGLPGSQKGRRAYRLDERLNASNYLRGPRVFGFTGVYRPFSLDAQVLEADGLPGPAAEDLVLAWEMDQQIHGFVAEDAGSNGAQFRHDASRYIGESLRRGESASPPWGRVSEQIGRTMTPSGAGRCERAALDRLIQHPGHEVRHILAQLMIADPPSDGAGESEISARLLRVASGRLHRLLTSASAYERCATVLTNTFRRLLQQGVARGQGIIRHRDRGSLAFADHASSVLPRLVDDAVSAAEVVDDQLAAAVEAVFASFLEPHSTPDFVEELILRHSAVQASKGKRTWLEDVRNGWYVRPPYRDQIVPADDESWIHPMRLRTVASFLAATR